ncbi:MAG TPA: hypothetical protein VL263_21565 [Vicinamibacterales bacterium]|nr:hypothetical protein [Vicinamibacterales bacterium]
MAVRDRRLSELALFVAAAVLHTWPLASAPGTWARVDNADTALNTWAIAWVGITALRDPLNLFHANIFFPEPRTLAFSEIMLPQALMGAPLTWSGIDPVVVYNLLVLAGFALSGVAMSWVVSEWTGSRAAGIVAGLAYAFNAHTLVRFGHLQAQHVQYLPLALYALDRTIETPGRRWAGILALTLAAQALTSNYLLVMAAIAMIAAVAVRPDAWRARQLLAVLGAAAASAVVLAPFLYQYWLVHTRQGLVRGFDEVGMYSATWRDWLSTGGRLHYEWWSHRYVPDASSSLFPGVTVSMLALIAIVRGIAWRNPRARMALTIGVAGLALAFGVNLPGYRWLYDHVSLLQGIRAVSRFGWLTLFALPILAGFTVSAWTSRLAPGKAAVLATALSAAVTIEALRAPMGFTVYEGIPKIYDRIAAMPDIVLAEIPFPPRASIQDNGPSVLYSAWHLKPLLNGYSGFTPASYSTHEAVMRLFPAPDSVRSLRAIGVSHVLLHKRRVAPELLKLCAESPEIALVSDEGDEVLYSLTFGGR